MQTFSFLKTRLFLPALLFVSLNAISQTDTLAPYLKSPFIPPFNIQMADSSWFSKNDLQAKPALILYFSPDCGHCQLETEELLTQIKELKDLQIVMITSRGTDEMKMFSDKYLLQKFPSIKIGSDTKRFVTRYYQVKFTPFSALYNKNGKLVKVYEGGIDFNELKELVHKS